MSQSLLQTELTDAVNTGIVDRADKSEKSLKSPLYSVGKRSSTGGAASAALAAVTTGRKGGKTGSADGGAYPKSRAGKASSAAMAHNAIHGALEGSELEGADDLYNSGKGAYRAGRAVGRRIRGKTASLDIKGAAKGAGKAAASGVARDVLQGSELEGVDNIYDGARAGYYVVKGMKKRLGGKDPLSTDKSLGKLSEKKSAKKAANTVEAKRKAQAAGYFKKNVYKTAEKAKSAAKAGKTVIGKLAAAKGGSGAFAMLSASSLAPLIIICLLFVCLLMAVMGGGLDEERKSATLEGMPGWVTYDLVLSCLKAHEEYGYPPSALLGQMMIENGTSDEGSDLGRLYHNYGGVKYFGTIDGLITGSVSMLTTEYIGGRPVQMYCNFAVFASDAAYMKYRCEYLYKQPNYTSVPNFQKAIDEKNSELFLKALGEGGYYTASTDSYVAHYRSICESYPLVPRLDSMTSEEFENSFGNAFYPGGGQDYASAEQWQKDIVNACSRVGWPGASLCATWSNRVYEAAGHPCSGNGNSVLGHQGYGASYYPSRATTDLSQIKVGMLVSAQFGSNTVPGNTYGHVGIYIGDGMVMDSINSGIRTISLSEWVSQNGRGWVVCGYPWDWR